MREEEMDGVWELPFAAQPALEFDVSMATLSIEPSTPDRTPCLIAHGRGARGLTPEIQLDGEITRVRVPGWDEAAFSGNFWGWPGKFRLTLYLPRAVRATVRTEAGRIRARGLAGCELSLSTDAGSIDLDDIQGRLRVRTSAGKIDGQDLAGSLDVETTAGAIRLRLRGLDPGTHRIHTDLGAVKLEIARGAAVRINARASMGATKIDFPSSPGAAAVLELSTEIGSLRVREFSRRHRVDAPSGGPYRVPAPIVVPAAPAVPGAAANEATPPGDPVERVLEMVAQGKLSPRDAGALLRELGQV
jgi:hypothetical protein